VGARWGSNSWLPKPLGWLNLPPFFPCLKGCAFSTQDCWGWVPLGGWGGGLRVAFAQFNPRVFFFATGRYNFSWGSSFSPTPPFSLGSDALGQAVSGGTTQDQGTGVFFSRGGPHHTNPKPPPPPPTHPPPQRVGGGMVP